MAFTTKDSFTFDHTAQPDYPNWIPSVTKTNMNARGEELRLALNAVVNLLNANALPVTTATRPTTASVGYGCFDTTINKPIWLKTAPSTWVDAMGAIV